jgi:hypothetical protein
MNQITSVFQSWKNYLSFVFSFFLIVGIFVYLAKEKTVKQPNGEFVQQEEVYRGLANFGFEVMEFDTNGQVFVDGKPVSVDESDTALYHLVSRVEQVRRTNQDLVFHIQPLEIQKRVNHEGAPEIMRLSQSSRWFLADENWIFFADKNLENRNRLPIKNSISTENAKNLVGSFVVFPVPSGSTEQRLSIAWDECKGAGKITGNYWDRKSHPCMEKSPLSNEFVAFMKTHLTACIEESVRPLNAGAVTKIHLLHNGTLGDARHKKTRSLHNVGRAIDIQEVAVTFGSNRMNFNFRKTNTDRRRSANCKSSDKKNCEFYSSLRNCWSKKMVSRSCPKNRNPRRAWIGSLGWEDKKHIAHHLHLSYPFCPKSNGFWTTDFSDDPDSDDSDPSDGEGGNGGPEEAEEAINI